MMLTDAIRLLLFPALMAFAASSDLFTMTISNRLSLALAGGFLPAHADHRHEPCLHSACISPPRTLVLVDRLRLLLARLDRRRRRQARSRDRACGSVSIICSII